MGRWPSIPYSDWSETCAALHLFCQIVGKYRLAHTPWMMHSWHATLYPNARGLTTGLIPDPGGPTEATFDFVDGTVGVTALGGRSERFQLGAMSVADFFDRFKAAVRAVGGDDSLHGAPNELAEAVPFAADVAPRPFDLAAVQRFHNAICLIHGVFETFRTPWLGKVSPVHLFWGSFDLAVTRFSGRLAPRHPGGIPRLPDPITHEAYSHEVASAGFWPGAGVGEPMFYAYAYPVPEGFSARPIAPAAARYDDELGEFLLPYSAVAQSDTPEADLLAFLHSAYEAARDAGAWPTTDLEVPVGVPRIPRVI